MTLDAIEKFVNLQLLIIGMLQLTGRRFGLEIRAKAKCWLRTESTKIPSEFVTRSALMNIIRPFLYGFGDSWIMRFIRKRKKCSEIKGFQENVA